MSGASFPSGLLVVVSCEHGGHEVPPELEDLFREDDELLRSHRGWDPGALPLARELAAGLGAPLHASTLSRLVVDLNRSPEHPRVFSDRTRTLPGEERERLLRRHHAPYREAVRTEVTGLLARGGPVLHLSVHSFTPVLDGRDRRTDLALLYDPGRSSEQALAARWVEELGQRLPGLRLRRNHPYRGTSDGLTTWLRRVTGTPAYLGVEIEVSQGLLEDDAFPARIADALLYSFSPQAAGTIPDRIPTPPS